jgi:YD repeat-containing protein
MSGKTDSVQEKTFNGGDPFKGIMLKVGKLVRLLLLVMLLPTVASAQSLVEQTYVPSDPQVWSFIKYGGQTPDLYTGTVRVEIPIYTYKDPDFELPIALSYASNGYMPNVQANFVGLGWSLIAGGVITRRVNGKKDEDNSNGVYGFFAFSQDNTQSDISQRETTYRNGQLYYEIGNKAYETEPDVFMFNFPGHTGKFMIREQGGSVKVFDTNHPHGEYKVDISELEVSGMFRSRISITTGDGYIYEFGVTQSTVNYHTSFETYEEDNNPVPPPTLSQELNNDSWVLTRITAPNGRYISFDYDLDQSTIGVGNCQPFIQKTINEVYTNYGYGNYFFNAPSVFDSYVRRYGRTVTTVPVARLSGITVYDQDHQTQICHISLYYEERTPERYKRAVGNTIELQNPGLLRSITVAGKNNHFYQTYRLSYSYTSSSGNRVLLLKTVSIPGLGEYSLTYFNEDVAFPYHGCASVDHWGFWNDYQTEYSPLHLLPRTSVYLSTGLETILDTQRDPDASVSISGMLKRITYPTGGWTNFEYESNDYRRRIGRNASDPVLVWPHVDLLSNNQIAGGLRVKKVTDYISSTSAVTKEYLYSDTIDSVNVSSGLMYNFPRYYEVVLYKDTPSPSKWLFGTSRTDRPAYLLDQSYMGYSKVTERFADGSYAEYHFTDYEDVPDDVGYDGVWLNEYNAARELNSIPVYADYFARVPQSLSRCRGKLKEKRIYNATGSLAETTEYTYNVNIASSKVSALKETFDSVYVYHSYVGNNPLVSTKHTTYSSSGIQPVVLITSYTYNSSGQVKSSSESTADAEYKKEYLYVLDLPSFARTDVEQAMVSRNIVSPFLRYTLSQTKTGITGARLIEGTKQDFMLKSINGQVLPVLSVLSSAVVSSTERFYSPYSVTWQPKTTITNVDRYGRPMEIKDANGIYTTYFWGYGGLYPVARFINCRIQDLNQRFHTSFNQFDGGWSGIAESNASAFRNVPRVLFTNWKYRILVGISEVTDPSGRKTSYSYNTYGQLTGVTGPDDNPVVEYDYSTE